jgi:hypothetical protein
MEYESACATGEAKNVSTATNTPMCGAVLRFERISAPFGERVLSHIFDSSFYRGRCEGAVKRYFLDCVSTIDLTETGLSAFTGAA